MSDLPPETLWDLAVNASPSSTARFGVQEQGGVMQAIDLAALIALVGAGAAGATTSVITASGETLAVGVRYTFRTGLAALSANLPPLSSVEEGQAIEWLDGDYNAGTNNITFAASGADLIQNRDASAATFVADVTGGFGSFTRSNGVWRAIANVF